VTVFAGERVRNMLVPVPLAFKRLLWLTLFWYFSGDRADKVRLGDPSVVALKLLLLEYGRGVVLRLLGRGDTLPGLAAAELLFIEAAFLSEGTSVSINRLNTSLVNHSCKNRIKSGCVDKSSYRTKRKKCAYLEVGVQCAENLLIKPEGIVL